MNPSTLAVEFELTLSNYPGRGGLGVPITFNYSSKVWRVAYRSYTPSVQNTFDGQILEGYTTVAAQYGPGWSSNIGVPIILHDEDTSRYSQFGLPLPETTDCDHTPCYRIDRVMIQMPDHSVHELRSSDEPYSVSNFSNQPFPVPDDLYAVDGSGLRYQRSTQTLFLPDGSRYILNNTSPSYIDRNGNTVTFTADFPSNFQDNFNIGMSDTLNRSIPPFRHPGNTNTTAFYSLPGVNGLPITYSLNWKHLGDTGVMSPGQTLHYIADLTSPGGPGMEPGVGGSPSLFFSDSAGRTFFDDLSLFNPVVLHQIVLPTGQTYTFNYNFYGELEKITFPGGGYERYEYLSLMPLSVTAPLYSQTNRGVTRRFVSSSGSAADELRWSYGFTGTFPYGTGTLGTYVLTTTAPDGSTVERYMHTDNLLGTFGFNVDQGKAGMAYEERQYSAPDASGTRQLLRRHLTEWLTSNSNASNQIAQQSAKRNARIAKEVAIVLDTGTASALAKTTVHNYDLTYQFTSGPIETSTAEYDWVSISQTSAQSDPIGSIPVPAQPVKISETTNLLLDAAIPQGTRDAYRARNLVTLPTSSRIKNGSGTIVAQSSIKYDEHTLTSVGAATGWNDPQTSVRGNVTTLGRWLNTTGSEIPTHTHYDQFGNVRIQTDAKGNDTQIGYSSNHAYATTITTAIPDSSGQYGSTASFMITTDHDPTTGLVTSKTDQNGQITTMSYNDPLNRLTQVTQPNGAHINYTYSDAPGDLYVKVRTDLDSSRAIESRTYFDGLGRTVRNFLYDGTPSTPWAVTDTYYDVMGRPNKVSNPYRVSSPGGIVPSSCAVCTTSAYDALDRVISTTTPDNATITTTYGANTSGTPGTTVLVTDQGGKKRKTLTDSLGRLIAVYEDPTGLNYLTTYTYDVLGNLRNVIQDSQTRTFTYDSLSRLRSAMNPESGTILYDYDNNGNLTRKTDARGVVSVYAYDALNRNITIDYSDTPAINPDVTRMYDGAANGKGRLWKSYKGGAESVGSNVEKTQVVNYDAVGRPLAQRQFFKSNDTWNTAYYEISVSYNLAGNVTSQIYPSGHFVSYNYDDAGRLADKDANNLAFTGNLGDGTPRTYSRGITYAPAGQLKQEQFGTATAVYNKLFYNSRQQLAEILVSTTVGTSYDRGRIVNDYSLQCAGVGCNATDNNGNLRRQTVYIPASDQISPPTSWYQQYDYDELNRLKRVHEYTGNSTLDWQQEYLYDRWGNRRIDTNTTKTFGTGINNLAFEKEDTTNRLYAPGDSVLPDTQKRIRYDSAGNQIKDIYTGYGTATFDAENHITAIQDKNSGITNYTYNADGQRTRRKVGTQETWHIYGTDGELLAEYPVTGNANAPQKEYGYRNGQLLIVADANGVPVVPEFSDDFNDNSLSTVKWSVLDPGSPALVSEQSQLLQIALPASTATYNGVISVASYSLEGKMVQLEAPQVVSQAGWVENALMIQKNATNYFLINAGATNLLFRSMVNGANDQLIIPYNAASHRFWRVRHVQTTNTVVFETSGNGTGWTTQKTVNVAFSLSGLKFQLYAGAYGTGNASPGAAKYDNFKLLSSQASFSTLNVSNSGFETPNMGGGWQYSPSGGSWTFASGAGVSGNGSAFTSGNPSAPEGTQIAFLQGSDATITQSVSGFQSGVSYSIVFKAAQRGNCCNAGGQDFRVYVDNVLLGTFHPSGASYLDYDTPAFTVSAGTHTIKFAAVNPLGGDHTAFIDNIRIVGSANSGVGIQWLVSDQLGTPRIVIDQTGSLAGVKRHDYLPFGEELHSEQGLRTAGLGYAGDAVRQQFTAKERDVETGLDYFLARYYSSTQGRFTSPDEFSGGPDELYVRARDSKKQALPYAEIAQPQSLNKYTYVYNNPCRYIDPNGHCGTPSGLKAGQTGICVASFIASTFVPPGVPPGRGDWRGPNGQGGTSRIEVRVAVDLSKGTVTKTDETMGRSGAFIKDLGPKGEGGVQVSSPNKDDKGNLYFQISQHGSSNVLGVLGSIDNHLNMVVTPDGKVGVTPSSTAKDYPSLEIYKYTVDDKGNVTTTLILHKKESGNMLDLSGKEKPIKADPK